MLIPFLILLILLVKHSPLQAITLEGAGQGLMLYITPDWSKLYTSECWIDSATQIFFAYSIGTGALPALGSYNKFYHNCIKVMVDYVARQSLKLGIIRTPSSHAL